MSSLSSNVSIKKVTGSALAMAVAGLAGCASATSPNSTSDAQAKVDTNTVDAVHCYDVNVCKGHNDCKTAENACAGHATCKGEGFVSAPVKSCSDMGGKVKDSARYKIASADLVHCYGANICKGHNDCKTAENACAGHGACKGQGFIALPAKSCGDVGGKVGA